MATFYGIVTLAITSRYVFLSNFIFFSVIKILFDHVHHSIPIVLLSKQRHPPGTQSCDLPDLARGDFPDQSLSDRQQMRFVKDTWYTCTYYSAYVDWAEWTTLNLPVNRVNLSNICNHTSISVYDLPDSADGGQTEMHVAKKKRQYLDLMFCDPVYQIYILQAPLDLHFTEIYVQRFNFIAPKVQVLN